MEIPLRLFFPVTLAFGNIPLGGGRHCVPQKKEGLDHVNFGLDAEKTKLFCLTVKDFKIAPERAT